MIDIDVIREALIDVSRVKSAHDALAALSRVETELAEARRAFKVGHDTLMRMQERAEAAEAHVTELDGALEQAVAMANDNAAAMLAAEAELAKVAAAYEAAVVDQTRLEAAEARVTALEAALHEARESRALNSQIRARQYLELEAKNKLLREAVLLLNGMVTCGEAHSERSTAAVVAALAAPTREDGA